MSLVFLPHLAPEVLVKHNESKNDRPAGIQEGDGTVLLGTAKTSPVLARKNTGTSCACRRRDRIK